MWPVRAWRTILRVGQSRRAAALPMLLVTYIQYLVWQQVEGASISPPICCGRGLWLLSSQCWCDHSPGPPVPRATCSRGGDPDPECRLSCHALGKQVKRHNIQNCFLAQIWRFWLMLVNSTLTGTWQQHIQNAVQPAWALRLEKGVADSSKQCKEECKSETDETESELQLDVGIFSCQTDENDLCNFI